MSFYQIFMSFWQIFVLTLPYSFTKKSIVKMFSCKFMPNRTILTSQHIIRLLDRNIIIWRHFLTSQHYFLKSWLNIWQVDFTKLYQLVKSIRRFRDRRSSVMEEILVLTHRHWWDKANTPYMEYDVYFSFKISFAFFACQ